MPFGGGKAAGSLDGHALPSLAPDAALRDFDQRMMLTPYLQSGEAATVGPPISRHHIIRLAASPSAPRFHSTSTRPCGVDSAPYFAAFVTSSFSTVASA